MEVDRILEHHGIKGQRWGVRHDPKTGRVSTDHRTTAQLRRKPVSQLSNQQLRTTNERLNLEQNFRRLNPSTIKRGETAVKAVIGAVALTTSVAQLANTPFGRGAIKLGKKAIFNTFTKKSIKTGLSTIGKS